MKKFISLFLAGSMIFSVPAFAGEDYTGAINQVKNTFDIPETENFDINNYSDGTLVLSWEDKKYNSIYAKLKNGVITEYNNYKDDKKSSDKKLPELQLKNKSNEKLKTILGNDYKNWKLTKTKTYDVNSTEFVYTRYIGEYSVNNDTITVSVSNDDGEVTSYRRNLTTTPDVQTPKNIISYNDAKKAYLANSNFGAWYYNSSKPIFTYVTENNLVRYSKYDDEETLPCIDAETGEFFYGIGHTDTLESYYSTLDSVNAKSGYNINTDEFISVEDAVKILNKKLNKNYNEKDFTISGSTGNKDEKVAYFDGKDESYFSINDKGEVLSFTKGFNDEEVGDKDKAQEILKNNGYNLSDFVTLDDDESCINYYRKINGIPSTTSYIAIGFDKNGQVIKYENYIENADKYDNVTPKISADKAFDIASVKFNFAPMYVSDSNGTFRLAYLFSTKPVVDYEGNILNSDGSKYYESNQIYTDVTNKEDKEIVLFLSASSYNFEDMKKFEPDKTITLNDFIKYTNAYGDYNEYLSKLNKYLGTNYTEKDGDTPLTVKQIITIAEKTRYKNIELLSSAFKEQNNDVYTNIALNLGAIKRDDDLSKNATRIETARYLYKIYFATIN